MMKMKNRMMAMMRRMMLSCDEATFLSTKANIESIGMMDRINLQMHLTACNHCRKFYRQSAIITKATHGYAHKVINGKVPLHRMSVEEKAKLQKLINNKIQSF